jgi:hypothetical protein
MKNIEGNTRWFEDWMAKNPDGQKIVINPVSKQPNFDRPRKI